MLRSKKKIEYSRLHNAKYSNVTIIVICSEESKAKMTENPNIVANSISNI